MRSHEPRENVACDVTLILVAEKYLHTRKPHSFCLACWYSSTVVVTDTCVASIVDSVVSTSTAMATNDDYMQSSPVAVVQVHLLVSKDGLFDYASVVCQKLASRYGLNHVVVRSATLPIEQLLLLAQSSTHNDDDKSKNNNIPVLFVYLSDGDPSTITAARISILEAESSIPVLSLDTATDVTRTTTSNQDPDDVALSIAKFCSLTSSSLRRKVAEVLVAHQQARIIRDAQFKTKSPFYLDFIAQCYE